MGVGQAGRFLTVTKKLTSPVSDLPRRYDLAGMNDQTNESGEQSSEPQVIVVKQAGNGFAVTALVLGVIGAIVGLVPIFFIGAWLLGSLALIFGFIGRSRAKREPNAGRGGMAVAGIILGAIAIVLGIVGVNTVDKAVDQLDRDLREIERELDSY